MKSDEPLSGLAAALFVAGLQRGPGVRPHVPDAERPSLVDWLEGFLKTIEQRASRIINDAGRMPKSKPLQRSTPHAKSALENCANVRQHIPLLGGDLVVLHVRFPCLAGEENRGVSQITSSSERVVALSI
jgi:hypothetical protein